MRERERERERDYRDGNEFKVCVIWVVGEEEEEEMCPSLTGEGKKGENGRKVRGKKEGKNCKVNKEKIKKKK